MKKEQMREKLEEIIEPNASIGVHCTKKTQDSSETDIYNEVITNGIFAYGGERSYHGLTSTFLMCGQNRIDFNFDKLYDWTYGGVEKKDNYQIIIAIPEVITNSEDKKYILGCWRDIDDFYYLEKISKIMPFNGIDIIQPEFIVGAIVWDDVKQENDTNYYWKKGNERLIINPRYIGLKSDEEKKSFYDMYLKVLLPHHAIEVSEKNYDYVERVTNEDDTANKDFYNLYMEQYKELNNKYKK